MTWPEKMITQAEAFAKAARWPVEAQLDERGEDLYDIVLICTEDHCGQSCGQLRRGITRHNKGVAYNASLDEMLSMVLRHMVMAHDIPLNTRSRPTCPGCGTEANHPVGPACRMATMPPAEFAARKAHADAVATSPSDWWVAFDADLQDNGPSDGSTPDGS